LLSRTATVARVALAANVALQVAVASAAAASHSGYVAWAVRVVVVNAMPVALLVLLPGELRSAVLRPLAPRGWPNGFLPYAVKVAAGALMALLVFSRSEIFVLQADHLALSAGVYALAFGLAAQMTAPVDALLGPMLPAAASLAAAAPERLAGAVLRGLRFTSLAAGVIAALAVPPVSVLVVSVYGTRFERVSQLLLPLALVSCVQSLNHPVTAFLYGLRRVGAILAINSVAVALDLAIAIATIGRLHEWGAVIANAAAQLVSLTVAAIVLKRQLDLPGSALAASVRTFAVGVAAAAAGWGVANVLLPASVPVAAAAAVGLLAGAVVFAGALRLWRAPLTPDDVGVLAQGMPRGLRRPAVRTLGLLGVAS
jgi:O-antigen/teichoic acid export membrane protein